MKFIKQIWHIIALWFVLGMCYATFELLFRGVTYVHMIWVGGLAGLLVGLLNEHPAYYNRRMWQQCFLGTLITVVLELFSGLVLNVWLRLGIWSYYHMPLNFYGQICFPVAAGWFFLMPFAIYTDDWLRYKLFGEEAPENSIIKNYILLFTGK